MPVFEYRVLNGLGRPERALVDAESLAEARRKLRAEGRRVLEIAESGAAPPTAGASHAAGFRRVAPAELAVATRQLATLLHAGMALVPALSALVEQLGVRPLGGAIARVRDKVSQGAALAAALAEHTHVFSDLYVNMVAAGEAAGALETVLLRLADVLEKRVNLMNKVRAALAYPLFLAIIGAAVIIFLLSFVVPSISKLFLEMNRRLPLPTLILIAISGFLKSYLWAMVLACGGAFFGLRFWLRTPAGRSLWDRAALRLPLFGDLVLKIAVARFARTLGVLLGSGVSILDALDIVKRVVGNSVLAGALEQVKESVRHGGSIADPLRRSGVFPPVVYHMVAVGENSGSVEDALLNVADAYENEVETSVGTLASFLEPLMIPIMGGVVGFIVLAILLPIFEINQAIR